MTITSNIHNAPAWTNHTFTIGERCTNGGNAYQCILGGTSTSAPTGTSSDVDNGGVAHFKWLSAVTYTTLQAWANTILNTTISQPHHVIVWADAVYTTVADTQFLGLFNVVTSTTNTITISCATGDSLRDATGVLAYNASNGVAFLQPSSTSSANYWYIDCAHVTIDGFQFKDPSTTATGGILFIDVNSIDFHITNCILDGFSRGGNSILWLGGGNGTTVENCLIIDRQTSSGVSTTAANVSGTTIVNCTYYSVNSNAGAQAFYGVDVGGQVVKNCVFFGWTAALSADLPNGISCDHSFFDNSNVGFQVQNSGGNGFNLTATNQFIAAGTDFRLKSTSAVIGACTPDITDIPTADDIRRNARGAVWDGGCTEFVPTTVSASAIVTLTSMDANATAGLTRIATVVGQVPTLKATGSFGQERFVTAAVQIPTLRCVASFGQLAPITGNATIASISANIIAQQSDIATAAVTITALSSNVNVAGLLVASAATYVSGISVNSAGRQEVFASAALNFPTLRCVSTAKLDDLVSAAVVITAITSSVAAELDNGVRAVNTLTVVSAGSIAVQEERASGAVTITIVSAKSFGDDAAVGVGTIYLNASGTGVIANGAAGTSTLTALSIVASGLQEDVASAVITLSIQSNPVVNPSQGIGVISLAVSINAIQENNVQVVQYITGIDCLANAELDMLTSGTGQLSGLAAASVGYQEIRASSVNTLALRSNIVVDQYVLAAGLASPILVSSYANAGQERFASGVSTLATISSPGAIADFELVASATISIDNGFGIVPIVDAGQEVLVSAGVNIPTLQAVSQGYQEILADATITIELDVDGEFGQSNPATGTVPVTSVLAHGIFRQRVSAAGLATVTTIQAVGLAGQGNALIGTGSISLSVVGTGTNPIAVAGVSTLEITAQGVAGQEAFVSGIALVTSLSDFARAAQEERASAVVTVGSMFGIGNALLYINAAASANIPTITASGIAYNGWVGTGQITITSLSSAVNVQQTYGVTGVNTLSIGNSSIAGQEVIAIGIGKLKLSASGTVLIGTVATVVAQLPTLTASGQAIISNAASGFSPLLISAFGEAYLSTLGQVTGTISIHAKGAVYPVPPHVEGEDIIYIDSDDRVVYVTE